MVVCITKLHIPLAKPLKVTYKSLKHFDENTFNEDIRHIPFQIYNFHGPCRAHVVFKQVIRFYILNELTFQVTWLQVIHPLQLYVGVVT